MAAIKAGTLKVTLAGGAEPLELRTANPDLVRWDTTAHKHGWPTAKEAPTLWATFVAWCAAKRLGHYDGKWEAWRDEDCLEVEFLDDEEDVDPTQPGPEPDSA